MRKKTLFIVLCLLSGILTLGGCGKSETDDAKTQKSEAKEEDEWEEMERINAEDDKRFALEDIQKAYNNFIQLKNEYIKRYGEYPEIKTED